MFCFLEHGSNQVIDCFNFRKLITCSFHFSLQLQPVQMDQLNVVMNIVSVNLMYVTKLLTAVMVAMKRTAVSHHLISFQQYNSRHFYLNIMSLKQRLYFQPTTLTKKRRCTTEVSTCQPIDNKFQRDVSGNLPII